QAEDGIRDATVTGVQTCALPIYIHLRRSVEAVFGLAGHRRKPANLFFKLAGTAVRVAEAQLLVHLEMQLNEEPAVQLLRGEVVRSEERRVGKESRVQWCAYA